jgi:hypothetical protein
MFRDVAMCRVHVAVACSSTVDDVGRVPMLASATSGSDVPST